MTGSNVEGSHLTTVGRRRWLISFALLFALVSSWSFALPLFAAPDELGHVVKSAATVRGQLLGTAKPGLHQKIMRVPSVFASSPENPSCFVFKNKVSAECAPPLRGNRSLTGALTGASDYQPLYYFLVGWPVLRFYSSAGIYLTRLMSAAIFSVLVASAFSTALAYRRPRPMVLAVAISVTPMAVFLGGSVNPSSIEIGAAALLWVTALLLVSEPKHPDQSRLLVRFTISGVLLAWARPPSPAMAACVLLVAGIAGLPRVRSLVRERAVRAALIIVGSAVVTSAAWALAFTSQVVEGVTDDRTFPAALREVIGRQGFNFQQMIGYFGWLDTPAPGLVYDLWIAVFGYLLFSALVTGTWQRRALIGGLVVAVLAGPVLFEAWYWRYFGPFWQGRYTLPVAMGVVLLAGLVLGSAAREIVPSRTGFLVAALGVAQALSFVAVVRRFAVGMDGPLNFLVGRHWSPPIPLPLVVVSGLVAIGALYWYVWRLTSERGAQPARAET